MNRVGPLNPVVKLAWVDWLGGGDTLAKGNKACGPALADRVNLIAKLTKQT